MNAADVITEAFTTEIVGNSDDYNGGRLSAETAKWLASQALDALTAEGFAVVELPVPSWDGGTPGVFWDLGGAVVECDGSRISLGRELRQPGLRMTTTDARDLAAALLAAAVKAEEAGR